MAHTDCQGKQPTLIRTRCTALSGRSHQYPRLIRSKFTDYDSDRGNDQQQELNTKVVPAAGANGHANGNNGKAALYKEQNKEVVKTQPESSRLVESNISERQR